MSSPQQQGKLYDPQIWGFNPISHHHVKKTGQVWKRHVKAGLVQDSDLMLQLQTKADGRKKKTAEPERKDPVVVKKAVSKSRTMRAVKLVARHQDELDDLESDAADEHIRKLLAKRLAVTESEALSSDSEPEPTEVKPARGKAKTPNATRMTSRIRLKSQPIPIPEPRTLRKQQLAASESDSDD